MQVENRQGLESFADILAVADAILLSRGNLGLDVAAEKMAMVQKVPLLLLMPWLASRPMLNRRALWVEQSGGVHCSILCAIAFFMDGPDMLHGQICITRAGCWVICASYYILIAKTRTRGIQGRLKCCRHLAVQGWQGVNCMRRLETSRLRYTWKHNRHGRPELCVQSAISACNEMGRPVAITRVVDTMVAAPRCTRY